MNIQVMECKEVCGFRGNPSPQDRSVHGLKVKLIQPNLNSFNTKATSICAILYFKMTKSCKNYSGSGGKAVVLVSWRPVSGCTILKIKVIQKVLQAMP